MGKHLFALSENAKSAECHFCGGDWIALTDLLYELGCDLTLIDGPNDGAVVDAVTATTWAAAIRDSLSNGRVYEVEYEDSWIGVVDTEFHVVDTKTPVKVAVRADVGRIVEQRARELRDYGAGCRIDLGYRTAASSTTST
jgi:hypothetical protein